jgi:hypothetical protein
VVLRKTYEILQEASLEAAEQQLRQEFPHLQTGSTTDPDPTVTVQKVQLRRQELVRLHEVAITVRGVNGDQTLATDPSVLEESEMPDPLQSVELEIGLLYRGALNALPQNRAVVHFDFTKPPLFDLSNVSGSPTPNASGIYVAGSNFTWVGGVYDRLNDVITSCRARISWIHARYVYDVLLVILGFPATLGAAAYVSGRDTFAAAPPTYRIAVFLYFLFVSLLVFRLSFSVTRFLLPYMEFPRRRQALHRSVRLIIASFIFAVLSSLVAAAIWSLFTHWHGAT